jgi:hypothetical protein
MPKQDKSSVALDASKPGRGGRKWTAAQRRKFKQTWVAKNANKGVVTPPSGGKDDIPMTVMSILKKAVPLARSRIAAGKTGRLEALILLIGCIMEGSE